MHPLRDQPASSDQPLAFKPVDNGEAPTRHMLPEHARTPERFDFSPITIQTSIYARKTALDFSRAGKIFPHEYRVKNFAPRKSEFGVTAYSSS